MGDTPTTTQWPDGQIARYRTRGDATVDLIPGPDGSIDVDCLGCGHHEQQSLYRATDAAERNERMARARAETHADRCRAIPPPVEESPSPY